MTLFVLLALAVAFTFGALFFAIGPVFAGTRRSADRTAALAGGADTRAATAVARDAGTAPSAAFALPKAGAATPQKGRATALRSAAADHAAADHAAADHAAADHAAADLDAADLDAEQPKRTPAALGPDQVLHRLYGFALDSAGDEFTLPRAEVDAALADAIATHAADPRYAPRRPMLLPQLLQAMNDENTSRRHLEHIITQDPALVGSLLKLANSPVYRHGSQPIESVNRAIAQLGTEGIRSLVAAALVQPVFRTRADGFGRFPELAWEHTFRSAAATEAYAALVESADRFAAQLLGLLMGLGSIVVFRIVLDRYPALTGAPAAAPAVAAALVRHTADAACAIAADWRLSERALAALEGERPSRANDAPVALGRSLRFGRVAGALSVLERNGLIDDEQACASLPVSDIVRPHALRIWDRLAAPDAEG